MEDIYKHVFNLIKEEVEVESDSELNTDPNSKKKTIKIDCFTFNSFKIFCKNVLKFQTNDEELNTLYSEYNPLNINIDYNEFKKRIPLKNGIPNYKLDKLFNFYSNNKITLNTKYLINFLYFLDFSK